MAPSRHLNLANRLANLAGNDGHAKELLRGASVTLVLRVTGALVTYLFSFFVARLYGASVVGTFAVATTMVMILGMLSRLGFDRAIVKFVAASLATGDTRQAGQQIWFSMTVVLVLGVAASAALFFAADVLAASVFGKPHLAEVFRAIAPAIVLYSLSLLAAESLRGMKRIPAFAFFRHVAIYAAALPALFVGGLWLAPAIVAPVAYVAGAGFAAVFAIVAVIRHARPVTFSPSTMMGALLAVFDAHVSLQLAWKWSSTGPTS